MTKNWRPCEFEVQGFRKCRSRLDDKRPTVSGGSRSRRTRYTVTRRGRIEESAIADSNRTNKAVQFTDLRDCMCASVAAISFLSLSASFCREGYNQTLSSMSQPPLSPCPSPGHLVHPLIPTQAFTQATLIQANQRSYDRNQGHLVLEVSARG